VRSAIPLALATAAVLAAAPSALANTRVSLENGTFGNGQSGDYVWVTDPWSPTDKRMDVQVTRAGTEIKVTDANGAVSFRGDGCRVQGAAAFCKAAGLEGLRIEGGDNHDVLASDVDLPTTFIGDGGNDLINGGPLDDQVDGQQGDDTLNGNGGNDTFNYEKGEDTVDGGDGKDTITYAASPSAVSVRLDNTLGDDGPGGEDLLLRLENVIGSDFADTLVGNEVRNILRGRAGDDTLRGRDGDDFLDGQGGGDDMAGESGLDTVNYADRTAPVKVLLNPFVDDGESGEDDFVRESNERIVGGSGGDTLAGNPSVAADNTLEGNGGNDKLDGGAGADTADGGPGADTLVGDVGADRLLGGPDTDTADYSSRKGDFTEDLTMSPNSPTLNDDGGASDGPAGARDDISGVESLITGEGNDNVISGASSGFFAGAPLGTIVTGVGGDTVTGSDSPEVINTGAGDDHIFANGGDDYLVAGTGHDEVHAGAGADSVKIDDGEFDAPVTCGPEHDDRYDPDTPLDFFGPKGQQLLTDCDILAELDEKP
jgi:Ca2+-binding RTX toxin-like protein